MQPSCQGLEKKALLRVCSWDQVGRPALAIEQEFGRNLALWKGPWQHRICTHSGWGLGIELGRKVWAAGTASSNIETSVSRWGEAMGQEMLHLCPQNSISTPRRGEARVYFPQVGATG